MPPDCPEEKLDALKARLLSLACGGRLAVAFSGGLDSRFLSYTAKQAGLSPLLLHAEGPHIAASEQRFAKDWAGKNKMDLRLLSANPLEVPEVAANGRMRCYHCKLALFTKLLQVADGLPLCDGTQSSDSSAYRPGVAALKELGIISPLADVGLGKPEIRTLAGATGMDLPEQQARPCLLTRFAYGLRPDLTSLAALDKAEERLGFFLRLHADSSGEDPPDFRLRKTEYGLELHMTPFADVQTGAALPDKLRGQLENSVRTATGRELDDIRVMASLSGFFDREQL
jgi:uncharacterized protein